MESTWMYQLIIHEDEIRLCEIYSINSKLLYTPISWIELFKHPIMIIRDILSQIDNLYTIPDGKFINEQFMEILGGYNG